VLFWSIVTLGRDLSRKGGSSTATTVTLMTASTEAPEVSVAFILAFSTPNQLGAP
jgi:hypothetical protein